MKSPVVLTGGTGYLGAQILTELLSKGYTVHLTARDPKGKLGLEWLKALMKKYEGKIKVFKGDLLDQDSFDEAMTGAKGVIHAASPFRIEGVKDAKQELIDPAKKGTRNVLNAVDRAATIEKVVVTSSVAAIHGDAADIENVEESVFSEKHWNTSSSLTHQPYSFSKKVAEQEAWKMSENKPWKLVTINPGFIVGPSVTDRSDSTSIRLVADMLSGRFKQGVPDLHFVMVDVRDVAKAHVLALENDDAEGRHVCAHEPMSMLDLANGLRKQAGGEFPKIPKKQLPHWLTYLLGPLMIGFSWTFLKNNLGIPVYVDNSKIRNALGIAFRPMSETLKDQIEQLKKDGAV